MNKIKCEIKKERKPRDKKIHNQKRKNLISAPRKIDVCLIPKDGAFTEV